MNCPHEKTIMTNDTTICLDCGQEWPHVTVGNDAVITLDEQYECDPWMELEVF